MIERDGKFVVSFAFDDKGDALDFEMYVAAGRTPPQATLVAAELARVPLVDDSVRVVNANVASNVSGSLTQVGIQVKGTQEQ